MFLHFIFVSLFYLLVIKNIGLNPTGKPQSRLCATERFNRKKISYSIVEKKIVFTLIYSMEILLVSCKDFTTNEEEITALDEIQSTNGGRIYNQGLNSSYLWVQTIGILTFY